MFVYGRSIQVTERFYMAVERSAELKTERGDDRMLFVLKHAKQVNRTRHAGP
jgi:hypothetical protein